MIKYIVSVVLGLSLAFSGQVAYAEDVVDTTPAVEESAPAPEPTVEETPAPEPEPEPEPAPAPDKNKDDLVDDGYTPPAEAANGAGGWAVVDPETGKVHGVIVGTLNTYNSRNGTIGHEYMGCSANCVLRYQTGASSTGNVSGYHGNDVNYNKDTGNFHVGGKSTTTTSGNSTATSVAGGMVIAPGYVPGESQPKEIIKRSVSGWTNGSLVETVVDEDGNESVITRSMTVRAIVEQDMAQVVVEELSDDGVITTEHNYESANDFVENVEADLNNDYVAEEESIRQQVANVFTEFVNFFSGLIGDMLG